VEEMEASGKRKVGRPRKTWKDAVRRDLELYDWMRLWHWIEEDGER